MSVTNTVRLVLDTVKTAADLGAKRCADIALTQGESNAAELVAEIKREGKPLDLTECEVYLSMLRADGKAVIGKAEIASAGEGQVRYALPAEVSAVPCDAALMYFEVRQGAEIVCKTEPIGISVGRGVDVSADQAEKYVSEYDRLLGVFNAIIDASNEQKQAQQTAWEQQTADQATAFNAAEQTRSAAESARVTAEQGRANAENTRVSQEDSRKSAESARVSAETARVGAETARVNAENTRVSQEDLRKSAETSRVNAESARASAENTRKSNETARQTAETGRVKAETDRETAQAKNNADQALNNAAMKKLEPYICGPGEYDTSTLMPTITGEANRIYYVPAEQGPGNKYVEWMLIKGAWEMMGVSQVDITAITTAEIDQVASDAAPTGESVLNLTGLAYVWVKFKAAFAPKSHASTATTYGASSASNYGHAKASQTTPKVAGTAALGSEVASFARGDHTHPRQPTVDKLTTPRAISLTGDVTGTVDFDGSSNAQIAASIANGAVTAAMLGDKMLPVYVVKSDTEAVSKTPCLRVVVDASNALQKVLYDDGGGSA